MDRTHRSLNGHSLTNLEPPSIEVRLERLDENTALLKDTQKNGLTFEWPLELLQPEAQVGDIFILELKTAAQAHNDHLKHMRQVLEELVG